MARQKPIWKSIDKYLLGMYMLLIFCGIITILSSSNKGTTIDLLDFSSVYGNQLIWVIISLISASFVLMLESQFIKNTAYIFYKEQTAIELSAVFKNLDQAVFTIKEILLAIPNTKDEEKFAEWYPFKSKIVAYVDFTESLFNLQMMVDKQEIKVVKRNDSSASTNSDKSLLKALKNNFKRVLILV